MTDELAFIQEIRAHPYDEVPRLIYADYLEATGDPRGEFIRVQCELERLDPGDPGRVALRAREQELLEQHAETWLEPLRQLGAEGVSTRCFQRGLIERVRIDAETFLENGEELCRLEPALFCLELRNPHPALERLVDSPLPAQITELDLSATRLGAESIRGLRSAPWVPQLTATDLQFNQLEDAGVEELVALPWQRLERLSLGNNNIGPAGAMALARCQTLRNLTTLRLNVNALENRGAEVLTRFIARSRLRDLELASNGIGNEGAIAIRQQSPASLERLNLRANRIGPETCQTLARWADAQNIALDIRNNSAPHR